MISVIVPLHNEELLVRELTEHLNRTLDELGQVFEIICVDDGSSDNTLTILRAQQESFSKIKILVLSRNYGHQAAMTAGMEYSKGDYVVLMDGDFQDPPELIPEMYKKLKSEDCDVVIAKRKSRKENFPKRFVIKAFHKLFRRLSGLENIQNTGNFCLMKRNVANALLNIKEKIRYLPGLRVFVGFKQAFVYYDRPKRASGSAKMSYNGLFSLATDAIFSFSKWPIKICLWLGLLGIFVLLLAGIYSVASKALNWAPFGWSSTILSIYFIGTIQLTFLGVIGEYLYRIYKEVQNRPLYFVREFIEEKEN